MELFRITENYEVELNKEWIMLVPAFANVIKSDKGSKGDVEGRKKLKARKQLAYVYFMVDFKSPIFTYEGQEKHKAAISYAGITEEESKEPLITNAITVYEDMQYKAARSIRTYKHALEGLDELDKYLKKPDFEKVDKMGKPVNTPKDFVGNLTQLNKAYDELNKFEKRVFEELKQSASARGKTDLGDKEITMQKKAGTSEVWEEGSAPTSNAPTYNDLSKLMNSKTVKVEEEEEDELS